MDQHMVRMINSRGSEVGAVNHFNPITAGIVLLL